MSTRGMRVPSPCPCPSFPYSAILRPSMDISTARFVDVFARRASINFFICFSYLFGFFFAIWKWGWRERREGKVREETVSGCQFQVKAGYYDESHSLTRGNPQLHFNSTHPAHINVICRFGTDYIVFDGGHRNTGASNPALVSGTKRLLLLCSALERPLGL